MAARQVLCAFPDAVRASHLLAGDAADFIINAYLALQRQWPDRGGFEHYLHLLAQRPGARAELLRQIATSPNATLQSVRFVDDLPPDHVYDPQASLPPAAANLGTLLRVARAVADVAVLQRSASHLVSQPLQDAVQTVVDAQLASLGLLESRLNSLSARVDALAAAPPVRARRRRVPRPTDWRQLRERQWALEAEVAALRAQLGASQLGSGPASQAVLDDMLAYFGAVPRGEPGPQGGA